MFLQARNRDTTSTYHQTIKHISTAKPQTNRARVTPRRVGGSVRSHHRRAYEKILMFLQGRNRDTTSTYHQTIKHISTAKPQTNRARVTPQRVGGSVRSHHRRAYEKILMFLHRHWARQYVKHKYQRPTASQHTKGKGRQARISRKLTCSTFARRRASAATEAESPTSLAPP